MLIFFSVHTYLATSLIVWRRSAQKFRSTRQYIQASDDYSLVQQCSLIPCKDKAPVTVNVKLGLLI